jgi:hypothetical protein
MKPEEQSARRFLKKHFGKEPRYEPLGKGIPPDFCIGRAAFEIRRLNQRCFREDGPGEDLEQAEYPLKLAVLDELGKVPFSNDCGSFFWGLSPSPATFQQLGAEDNGKPMCAPPPTVAFRPFEWTLRT